MQRTAYRNHDRAHLREVAHAALFLSRALSRACRRRAPQFVVVAGISAKAESWRAFGITGNELVLVMVQIKIEGIPGIHIDHNEIGIPHGQLAEA